MGTLLLIFASALWGLLHSLLASSGIKDAARRALGDSVMNWYRLLYNFFAVASFIPLVALASLLPDSRLYEIPNPWVVVTMVIQLMAVVLLVVGVVQTDVWSFIGLRQTMGGESGSSIVTGGLYRYVRHPLYSAGLVFIWLTPAMTMNRLVIYVSLTLYIIIGIYFEERKLIREFGKDYYNYQGRTPMLVPFLPKRRV